MSRGTLRQILLLTDGCSNTGEDPIAMAALAKEEGITINVIGVIEQGQMSEQGIQEVEGIAMAGGGVSQIVYTQQLSQTVQMVTRKGMTQTIQGVVSKELEGILGKETSMEDLEPEKRGQVTEVVDELGETMDLDILILVDTSASMKSKLPMVQEALTDLSVSLNARTGDNQFSVYSFPAKRKSIERRLNWTPKLETLTGVFDKLSSGGVTPTGPALQEALNAFRKRMKKKEQPIDEGIYLEEPGM
ncbi:vWA domain-containing protein [Texcoconibacillus texcoconensis]|uniref:Ca-activated chloride channel family protein n=1 Tax=Texcoconibacillus texcoconensis TaxID=1095777 RepID=A0A840QUA7_9BACI|nr:VWA domain-containing protein [Texcoconibacillus texcoconensis]MBB5174893.1 Ca-activated chloride channel family protein [Texcoconibacillus texcoconensis]